MEDRLLMTKSMVINFLFLLALENDLALTRPCVMIRTLEHRLNSKNANPLLCTQSVSQCLAILAPDKLGYIGWEML